MDSMPQGDLHPQFVIPDRIFPPSDHKSDAAGAVLPADKIRVFLRRLLNHEVVNNTQMAPVPVAATSQHFINHICRNGCLSGIESHLPFLNRADLLFYRRQFRQR